MELNKLKELARKGEVSIDALGYGEGNIDALANLIVEECISVMCTTADDAFRNCTYMGDDVPSSVHINEIRKHFGVIKWI